MATNTSTHYIIGRLGNYKVVVSEGYRASVYKKGKRAKIGHWVISAPISEIMMGIVNDRYVAACAVEAAEKRILGR